MQLTGTVYHIGDLEVKSERFKKQELVLLVTETNGEREFKNYPKLDFVNGNIDKLDGLNIGNKVTVHYNIQGNRFEKDGIEKFFTSVVGWKVEKHAENSYKQFDEPF